MRQHVWSGWPPRESSSPVLNPFMVNSCVHFLFRDFAYLPLSLTLFLAFALCGIVVVVVWWKEGPVSSVRGSGERFSKIFILLLTQCGVQQLADFYLNHINIHKGTREYVDFQKIRNRFWRLCYLPLCCFILSRDAYHAFMLHSVLIVGLLESRVTVTGTGIISQRIVRRYLIDTGQQVVRKYKINPNWPVYVFINKHTLNLHILFGNAKVTLVLNTFEIYLLSYFT